MGQGGAFVELITVRRGAYARRYIQTALKVVAINPRGSPFPVLATRLLLSSVSSFHAALPRDTRFEVLIGVILASSFENSSEQRGSKGKIISSGEKVLGTRAPSFGKM